jgi:hypothetical protein
VTWWEILLVAWAGAIVLICYVIHLLTYKEIDAER